MNLLIALQFYPGDIQVAMETAELIAQIEPASRGLDDFLFMARFDCKANDAIVAKLAEKFRKVYSLVGTRKETGWPAGCNGVWHDLMIWCQIQKRDYAADWSAVLTMESDCVPLCRDWIDKLKLEWEKAHKLVVGHYLRDPKLPHINGNGLFDPEINAKIPQMYGTPLGKSWDCHHASKIIPHAYDTPLIISTHRKMTITEKELYAPRLDGITPVFYHGVKDGSARDIVRKKLLKKKKT